VGDAPELTADLVLVESDLALCRLERFLDDPADGEGGRAGCRAAV